MAMEFFGQWFAFCRFNGYHGCQSEPVPILAPRGAYSAVLPKMNHPRPRQDDSSGMPTCTVTLRDLALPLSRSGPSLLMAAVVCNYIFEDASAPPRFNGFT
jgi:hypothetical protein